MLLFATAVAAFLALSSLRCQAAYSIYSSAGKSNDLENAAPAGRPRVSNGNGFRDGDWRANEIEHQLPDDAGNRNGNSAVRYVFERTTPRSASRISTAAAGGQQTPDFANDDEIHDYLKESDTDAMIWSCQNYIRAEWRGRAIPFVDLACDVIGEVKSLEVSFKGQKLDFMKAGSRYSLSASPMRTGDGRFSNSWLRYRIRIHNAARRDSGKYEIQLLSAQNHVDKQVIIVDIRRGKSAGKRSG